MTKRDLYKDHIDSIAEYYDQILECDTETAHHLIINLSDTQLSALHRIVTQKERDEEISTQHSTELKSIIRAYKND